MALLLFGLLPFAAALSQRLGLTPLVETVDVWFEAHCHREPHRLLRLGGLVTPVCARCAGLYGGLVLGAAISAPKWSFGRLMAWAAAAAAVLAADVLTDAALARPTWGALRFATGAALAYPLAVLLVLGARPGGAAPLPAEGAHRGRSVRRSNRIS